MNWPITHESDRWPERRWAVEAKDPVSPAAEVRPFPSEWERDRWVEQNPGRRRALGKRQPLVKALRRRWARETGLNE